MTAKEKKGLNFVRLDSEGGGVPMEVRNLPKNKSRVKAIHVLTSRSWIDTPRSANSEVYLPFIDKVGKTTGTVLYRADISPQGYISTVISTIFRRLKFWVLRNHKIHEWNIRQNLLLKCCAYYAIYKNVYFWDRILALTKTSISRTWRTISSLLHSVSSKLDEHKWFVYGHVCLQTQWLTHRALRPRDKSAYLSSKENFTLPVSIRGRGDEALRFSFDAVWSCFTGMHQI
jgi:hypothetical protein